MLAWLYVAKPETHALAQSIRHTLAVALVVSAVLIALYPWLARKPSTTAAAEVVGRRKAATVVLGAILGVLVALSSAVAGAIGVVVLTSLFPALMARRLVGTDIVHAIPLTFVAGIGHLGMGNIDISILAALLAGSVPGIALGSRVTGMLPDWLLRVALALVLLYAAYVMSWR